MAGLGWTAWYTLAVILVTVSALVREWASPALVFLGALAALLAAGVLEPTGAFSGFANPAVLTVAALYVVAAGVQRTNALSVLDRVLFSKAASTGRVLARLMLPVSLLSAVLNNTPIVAMLTPRIQAWAARRGLAASKLMIPLSYAAIAGGMTTLIGTSTNLVVSGLLQAEGYGALGFFDVAWVGVPVVFGVAGYFALGGHRLLPNRQKHGPVVEEGLRECLFEVKVAPESPLIGQAVEAADLRALGDAYLVHLRREGEVQQAGPQTTLQAGDVLTFTGNSMALERLLQREGLERGVPALEAEDDFETLPLFEAVVATSSGLVGKTLRELDFRERYRGVVLAMQRKNEQIISPLGRTPIRAGDLLLIEAPNGFDRRWNARRDEFYLVAPRRAETQRARSGRAPVALLLTVGMIAVAALQVLPIATAAFLAALAMIATRCLSGAEALRALNLQVLAVIAAALGLGQAVEATGLAEVLAHGLLSLTLPLGTLAALAALYVATNLLTEMITNNAAAVLMLPIALAAAPELGAEPRALAVLVAVAASASFMTPIGYQTNLMVMAPGGYRFGDYARAGLPVSVLVMLVALTAISFGWV